MKTIIIALLATVLLSSTSFALNYQTASQDRIVVASIEALADYAPSCDTSKEYGDHIEHVYGLIYDEVLQHGYYPTLELVDNLDISADKKEYRHLLAVMAGTAMRAKEPSKERQLRLYRGLAVYIYKQLKEGKTSKDIVKEFLKYQKTASV